MLKIIFQNHNKTIAVLFFTQILGLELIKLHSPKSYLPTFKNWALMAISQISGIMELNTFR